MFCRIRLTSFLLLSILFSTLNMNNTLIVYASRHGTTAVYAKSLLKLLIGNVDLCFLNERANSLPNLSVYNTIVIGGSIHYGKNNKSVSRFTKENIELLKTKRLGLYVTSFFEGDKAIEQLHKAYPKELIEMATVVDYFDGELLYPKMSSWEKFVAKAVLNDDEIRPLISKPKITEFANKLNQNYEV